MGIVNDTIVQRLSEIAQEDWSGERGYAILALGEMSERNERARRTFFGLLAKMRPEEQGKWIDAFLSWEYLDIDAQIIISRAWK